MTVPLIARAQDCIAACYRRPRWRAPSVFRLGEPRGSPRCWATPASATVEHPPHTFACRFDSADAYWQAFLADPGWRCGGIAVAPARPRCRQAACRSVADDLADHRDGDGYFDYTVLVATAGVNPPQAPRRPPTSPRQSAPACPIEFRRTSWRGLGGRRRVIDCRSRSRPASGRWAAWSMAHG